MEFTIDIPAWNKADTQVPQARKALVLETETEVATRPLVSIVVTAHNNENFIGRVLGSIQNQRHVNLQIIVVNDCSSDDTLNIIKGARRHDDRIELITRYRVGGGLQAKLDGMAQVRGEFFMLCDGDTWLEPDAVTRALNEIGEAKALLIGYDGRDIPYATTASSGMPIRNLTGRHLGSIPHALWACFFRLEYKPVLEATLGNSPCFGYFEGLLTYFMLLNDETTRVASGISSHHLAHPFVKEQLHGHLSLDLKCTALIWTVASAERLGLIATKKLKTATFFKLLYILWNELRQICQHRPEDVPLFRKRMMPLLRKYKPNQRWLALHPKVIKLSFLMQKAPLGLLLFVFAKGDAITGVRKKAHRG